MQRARPRIARIFPCNASIVGGACEGTGAFSLKRPLWKMLAITSNIVTSSVVSAVGQIERFVDQGKIGNDVAQDCVFEKRPILPRALVSMAAPNPAVRDTL